jgi:hypothetical protein
MSTILVLVIEQLTCDLTLFKAAVLGDLAIPKHIGKPHGKNLKIHLNYS